MVLNLRNKRLHKNNYKVGFVVYSLQFKKSVLLCHKLNGILIHLQINIMQNNYLLIITHNFIAVYKM